MCLADMRVFFTTAIDLVISGIQQPVRFAIETRAKIYSANERFWQLTKKIHSERFYVSLKAVSFSTYFSHLICIFPDLQLLFLWHFLFLVY